MVNIQDLRTFVPLEQRQKLGQLFCRFARPAWLGTIRRVNPLSEYWGFDRGTPIDRYYIELFLEQNRQDIQGHVLEVLNSNYTDRFGAGVEKQDVLDIDSTNSRATIVADLAAAHNIPDETFDCFILTQTLHLIYELEVTLGHVHRILRRGGVLLLTVPSLSGISYPDGTHHDYWRFTPDSCTRLFGDVFGEANVTVHSYGNVLTGVAFLMAMARQELSPQELDHHDPAFPVVVTVRAVKK